MDRQTAASLLGQIRQEKQAGGDGWSWVDWIQKWLPYKPRMSPLVEMVHARANQAARDEANRKIFKALTLAGGAGLALRGAQGAINTLFPKELPETIGPLPAKLPVAYDDKENGQKTASVGEYATSPFGVPYYIPAMLLGTPLAAFAGWKGLDYLLDSQRHKKVEDELERSKQEYQKALEEAYKTAADGGETAANLDAAFAGLSGLTEKSADDGPGLLESLIKRYTPNLPGAAVGLYATYALPTALAGYVVTKGIADKFSRRKLLEKAIKEREKRYSAANPAGFYAVPLRDGNESPE